MSREEKINKMIEEIKTRRNDEQYRGGPFPIYHIEFDILNEEIKRLNNIINELENYLNEQVDYMTHHSIERMVAFGCCRYKLQELKGSDKE